MSYDSSNSDYVMAGPSRPRFTGWLTMAPELDTKPLPSGPTSSAAFEASVSPKASTHGLSFVGAAATAPARRKKGATFQIGPFDSVDEDKSHSASGSTSSSPLSDVSDPPPFDVRTSFAPMPEYGRVKQQQAQEDDSDGIVFAGRQWKGKTVHAVEQEMEELRDESLMSHAPDATYLASRLEGLRRNLEVEEYKPNYIEYDDDSGSLSSSFTEDGGRRALPIAIAASPLRTMSMDMDAVPALSRPVSNASSTSLAEGVTPQDTTLEFGFDFGDDEEAGSTRVAAIDPAAKAAALDARIEMRPLRRNDLEQVRDLHTLHGDGDTPQLLGDTYTTSASFLLRLLVDDRHVCLVAQAKPLPTPELPLPQAQAQAQAAPSVSASVSVSPGSESTLSDSLFSRHADTELTSPSVAPAPAPAPAHELEPDSPGCIYHLPGPAVDLPPPAVTRTLGPPPPKGASRSPDTILGVISAHVAPVRPPTEILLDDHPSPASPPKQVDAHILTVAVAPAERGQGLGARLLDSLLAALPPRVTRTYLEVHPSNHSALALYNSRGFARVPGDAGTKRSFYRGDPRIPLSERLKPNGTDAWVLERFSQ